MSRFVRQHWFLLGLLILIPLGVTLAQSDPSAQLINVVNRVRTPVCTAAILFLMSVTLNSGRLWDSLRRPWPVFTAIGVNQLMIPLMALPLLAFQKSADMKVGLLIAASVPCTMAAASVWTRRAAGNDEVSLLGTLVTNGLCFVVAPLWMTVGTTWFGTADTSNAIQFGDLMVKLTLSALLPAVLGQLLRLSASARDFVDHNKPWFSNSAQVIILSLVFISVFKGGLKFGAEGVSQNLRHAEFATVWASCIALHVAGLWIAWSLSGVFGFDPADRRATAISGSQKTLPIGILIAEATGLPFSLLPMLMYHASQLFIDTWIADRMKSGDEEVIN